MALRFKRAFAGLLLTAAALPAAAINHDAVVAPLSPTGKFSVACSNVAQGEALIAQYGGNADDFWEGRPVDGEPRYISQILAYPQAAIQFDAIAPDERSIYPQNAGAAVRFVAIVCHPTPRANDDPSYVLPQTGDVIPHMQPPGEGPKLLSSSEYREIAGLPATASAPNLPARLPYIVFSHGLGGSPISHNYVAALVDLASQGYVVGAVFHGDARFSRIRVEDFSDFWYLVTQYDHVAEMQLMRPLSLKAMTDVMLAHPGFAPAIDTERIAGFGASLGGEAMVHLLGAPITTSIGGSCHQTAQDPRIKAAVGLVPYAGQPFLPAFCDDQGAAEVTKPFLALSGTADTTAPLQCMQDALEHFRGSRYLVELVGVPHEYKPEYAGDLFTWMVTFFNAYLKVESDPGAMARLIRMRGVQGGPEDNLLVDVHVPFPTVGEQVKVVEFHNTISNHYFITYGLEAQLILGGSAGAGWELTGLDFNAWPNTVTDTSSLVPVCRFYGGYVGGPNSHFFTASPGECALVKTPGSGWAYEGIGFYIVPMDAGGRCPDGYLGVNRAYNNRYMYNDSNHRFTTSDSTIRDMVHDGWTDEGIRMCSPP